MSRVPPRFRRLKPRFEVAELELRNVPAALYAPADVAHAYRLDHLAFQNLNTGQFVAADGRGQTIAIVDAYGDPNIAHDLAAFDAEFGIADPPNFTIEDEYGDPTSLPPPDKGWAGETALDVEWAHAIAPGANILLVEAYTASTFNLYRAVDTARNAPGVSVVSLSFGGDEYPNEANDDDHFTTPAGHTGVTFVSSSGDVYEYGEAAAYSPNVLAVGGTTLTVDGAGNYAGEVPWRTYTPRNTSDGRPGTQGTSGGFSEYQPRPAYQAAVTSPVYMAVTTSGP